MNIGRQTSLVLALGATLYGLTGCAAPMGPIGGARLNGCFTHCRCTTQQVCGENDPTIVPPHSNFHPLPTRPVFSPPESIPGVYNPWPGGEVIPPQVQPVEPLEVQTTPHSSDDPPPPPRAIASSSGPSDLTAGKSLSLRR